MVHHERTVVCRDREGETLCVHLCGVGLVVCQWQIDVVWKILNEYVRKLCPTRKNRAHIEKKNSPILFLLGNSNRLCGQRPCGSHWTGIIIGLINLNIRRVCLRVVFFSMLLADETEIFINVSDYYFFFFSAGALLPLPAQMFVVHLQAGKKLLAIMLWNCM